MLYSVCIRHIYYGYSCVDIDTGPYIYSQAVVEDDCLELCGYIWMPFIQSEWCIARGHLHAGVIAVCTLNHGRGDARIKAPRRHNFLSQHAEPHSALCAT